jgi:hypothetical protein
MPNPEIVMKEGGLGDLPTDISEAQKEMATSNAA